jgi:plastocyanin
VTEGENGAAAPNGRFDVAVNAGESSEVTFGEPGDYRITCQFHPQMHLLVHAH